MVHKLKNILSVSLFVFLISDGFAGELITRVPHNDYPPFFMTSKNGTKYGLSIELADALLKGTGINTKYIALPFVRGLWYLKTGDIHMMLNLSIKKERAEYINFVGPQLDEIVVLVVPKNSDYNIKSCKDFKKLDKPIGIERKKYYGKDFEHCFQTDRSFRKKIEVVTDITANEKKLSMGRISGFLGYGYNIYYRFKKDTLYKKFKLNPVVLHRDLVYFGFSKKSVSDELLKIIRKSYRKAVKRGAFEKIAKRYRVYQ